MLKITVKISLFCFFTSVSFAQQNDKIIGKYHLPNNLDVEIFKNNAKYYGKIIALNGFEDGQTKDINNPDKSKHNEALTGKLIVKDLEYDQEKKEWINGRIYSPEKGIYLNFKITKAGENEIVVVGSKYIFWKTLVWKKL